MSLGTEPTGMVGFLRATQGKRKPKLPLYIGGEECFCSRQFTAGPTVPSERNSAPGGSLLQLDQCRDQPASLAFGIPYIRPLSISPVTCDQQACCSSLQLADG